ncbi:MAG: hypothetical protein E7620_08960, partial [Ruminococcaceae bacterium]|nr:hypothetical protein [Oscillospiraceae bacterium]
MTKDEISMEPESAELPPLPEPPDLPPPPNTPPELPPDKPPTEAPKPKAKKSAAKPKKEPADPDTVVATTATVNEPPKKEPKPPRSENGNTKGNEPPKSTKAKSTASGSTANPTASKKVRDGQIDLELPRSSRPAHRVIPYLLLAITAFLALCMILNLFCNANNRCAEEPASHLMGSVGYYVCYGLFGAFGTAAFLIPLLTLNLALCWKKYIDAKLLPEKTIVSALLLVLLSTLIHSFNFVMLDPAQWDMPSGELIFFGAQMRGGGLIGGGIGYFLASNLNVIGAVLVSLLLTIIALFFFLGMTPKHVWERFRANRDLKHSQTVPVGVDDEENIRKEMKRKHDRAANRGAEPASEPEPPEGAVQVVKASNRGTAKDKTPADIPIPVLDGTRDGTDKVSLFIPSDLRRQSEEEKKAAEPAPAEKAEEESKKEEKKPEEPTEAPAPIEAPAVIPLPAPKTERKPSPAPIPTPPPRRPVSAVSDAQIKAMDAMFPRSHAEAKNQRRVQKTDVNFELGTIFVEKEEPSVPEKPHEPLPPEVPMPNSVKRPRPASAVEEAKAPSAPRTAPTPPPKRPPANPAKSAPTANGAPPKPILRQISKTNANYEPSEEELTKHETELLRAAGEKPRPVAPATTKQPQKPAAPHAPKPVEEPAKPYVFPPISYLTPSQPMSAENQQEISANTDKLTQTLANFKVHINEISYSYGPTVTRYEIFPSSGVRVRTLINLADDIALAFAVPSVRMEAVDGMSAIGVEVPNKTRQTVYLRDLIESEAFTSKSSKLTAGLGADVTGTPWLFDIAKMPHMLVAGATGMGKSVCINCIITSILYKARPDEVKLILIDPKKVEFALYKGIPHLMAPIILTPKDAAGALQAAVNEMEDRFNRIQEIGVNDIFGYNQAADKDPELERMPQIVIVIDELADLMMTAKDEVETSICRLAQKARAAGMHIIVGTQRPSVDVVTGLIKSNIPSRIACTVASQVDSRTILDFAGAEKLLGKGDMLFNPIGAMKPTRLQGAFVSSDEVEHICEFIRTTN